VLLSQELPTRTILLGASVNNGAAFVSESSEVHTILLRVELLLVSSRETKQL
jgi:hypothetical protein